MRIAIDCRTYGMSGIGRYIDTLLRQITEDGNTYLLIDHERRIPEDLVPSNCTIIQSDLKPYSTGEILKGISYFRQLSKEVDHLLFTSFNIPLFTPKGSSMVLHDLILLKHDSGASLLKRLYLRFVMDLNKRRFAHIITISEASRLDIAEELNIPEQKIDMVYHQVPAIVPQKHDDREDSTTIPENFFLYVGNRRPHKNIAYMMAVCDELFEKHPDWSLVIAGRRSGYEDDVDKTFPLLKHQDRFLILEDVSDQLLIRLYQETHCCLLFSRYEGFGYPPLEAGTYGKPTVVSDRFSLPEIVDNPDVVVDIHSIDHGIAALEKMITDTASYQKATEKAVERTTYFSTYPELEMTLDILKGETDV